MEQLSGYEQRLAELEAKIDGARLAPDIVIERAAGILAGRIGGRIDEVHTYLRLLAHQQRREVHDVAAEVLAAVQGDTPARTREVRAAVDEALRPAASRASGDGGPARAPQGAGSHWAGVVQQVLDEVGGRYLAVEPERNDTGQVAEFRIVAASPSVQDLSGRRGTDLVGRCAGELYPSVRDGPVWESWHATLTDGIPREVGPFPYVPRTDGGPVPIVLTARVRPIGTGLLSSWVRHDEDTRLAERIAQTERLGNLGWVEWDMVADTTVWSDELYRIYERDPLDGPLPRSESEAMALREDEPIRRQAREAFGRGETVDAVIRIRIGERVKHVRTVLDADRDTQGRPLRVYGIVQDVTARETSRAKLAEVERQLHEHQQNLAAEHRLAAQLQQIVLPIPASPFDLPGLRVAVRYLPAEQASRVGGDWFHATAARDGAVMLAVGDVAGHGIHAATTMAQLRHALAALAVTTTTEPAELLTHLNQLLYEADADGDVGTATAVIARYEPGPGVLTWAQAGHPAPLRSRVGTTTELARPYGPLLGAIRHPDYGTATTRIEPGDLLVFYTDGLIEHRDRTLAEGLAPVIATLNRITTEPRHQPLSDLLAQLRRANPDDDTCLLAARLLPRAGAAARPREDPDASS